MSGMGMWPLGGAVVEGVEHPMGAVTAYGASGGVLVVQCSVAGTSSSSRSGENQMMGDLAEWMTLM